MILDKNNKFAVEVGDILKFDDGCQYKVLARHEGKYNNALTFKLECLKDGFILNNAASSNYYGAEIIKGKTSAGIAKTASDSVSLLAGQISSDLLHMQTVIGYLKVRRDRAEDDWGSVGSLNYILEKLEEVKETLDRYADFRLHD